MIGSDRFAHARWLKSSHSGSGGTGGGDCVEVAGVAPVIAVRDSKDPEGPMLVFSPAHWAMFLGEAKSGAHDAWRSAQQRRLGRASSETTQLYTLLDDKVADAEIRAARRRRDRRAR